MDIFIVLWSRDAFEVRFQGGILKDISSENFLPTFIKVSVAEFIFSKVRWMTLKIPKTIILEVSYIFLVLWSRDAFEVRFQ